ncbi:MAG: efflux RND transporter periplasmic adaptor subunit [Rhodospirillales bacterium]|nr:efflux RND transporter periplasmic adaptor subunit [Rhodospirillales bacterium]
MKRTVIFTFVFLLLAAMVGGFAYFQFILKPEMIKGAMMKSPPPTSTVAAEPAKTETWTPKIPAIGTFVAVQGIDVAPQVDGIVRALHFDSGQMVEAGALLVELDDFVEQADLKSNVAVLKKSELDLERQRELLVRGNTPQTSFDSALSQRDTAAAAVERTRAVIAQKAIKAPFRGRLGIRNVSLGQYVSPGTALVTLQKQDPLFVDFPVPEQRLDVLKAGQTVEVQVDAFPEETFIGAIASIDAKVNQETRNVLVRAEVANADRRLLPGMFANVEVLAGAPTPVVTLPRTAVIYSLYGDSVYAVKRASETATAERRFIRVGETRGDRVAIAEGVAAGDEVVTTGQLKLLPGASIRVDNATPLQARAARPKE